MSYSSRQQSSRRAFGDMSDSSHATYHDYEDRFRPRPLYSEHHVGEVHSALSSHGAREPRSATVTSRRVTVTRYRIHASESTTSYHKRTEYTPYGSRQSSSGYRERRHPRPCSCTDCSSSSFVPNHADERSFPDEGHRDPTWQPRAEFRMHEASSQRLRAERSFSDRHTSNDTIPKERKPRVPQSSAEERRRHPSYAHAKHSQPKESEPAYKSGYSGKSRNYDSSGYSSKSGSYDSETNGKSHNDRQEKFNSSSSRRKEKHYKGKSDNRREKDSRSSRNDQYHEDREQRPHSKAKEKLPDHYAALKLGPLATSEEIKSAAKRRRVEVHPDKLKKPGMSDSERAKIDAAAAEVGQAADVLSNPEQKLEYDRQLYAAKG